MVFGVVMFLFCFVVCVWFRFLVAAVARGEIQFTGVCVFGFFLFLVETSGTRKRDATSAKRERIFQLAAATTTTTTTTTTSTTAATKKKTRRCVCCGTRKWFRFFLGVEKFGEKNCRKSRPSRRRRVQAEPTPKSTLTGLHS